MKNPSGCGVVISYRPSFEILRNVELLRSQVDHVIVVDNTPSSDADSAEVLLRLEAIEGCMVLRTGSNLGISAALNIGIRHGIALGCEWILTFDQDSRIAEGYVQAMLSAYREAARHAEIGMLCPRYKDARLDIFLPTHRAANGDVTDCMTSGSMMRAETFQTLGPMEEQLFIDYVDYEYCLRMRSAGMKIVECQDAMLYHSLGRMTTQRFLGRQVTTTNHSPARRYYIHRNRLVLVLRYASIDPKWALPEFRGWVMDSVKILLLEKQKMAKLKSMARATYDAIFHRLGARVPL